MVKKKLLSLKTIKPTKSIEKQALQLLATDRRERDRLVYLAAVENGILKISVYSVKNIVNEYNDPNYVTFISRSDEKWLTYEPSSCRWFTGKIDNIRCNTPYYYWLSKETLVLPNQLKTVNSYLGTQKSNIKSAVLEYQNRIKKDALLKKCRNELEGIDMVMDEVPELPKDFFKWVAYEAFKKERYVIYKRNEGIAYCTHCQKTFSFTEKVPHNYEGECPKCKSKVIFKSWLMQKYITTRKDISILQRLKDNSGYIFRVFGAQVRYDRSEDYRLTDRTWCHEFYRHRLDDRFVDCEFYEYGTEPHMNKERWCHMLNHGMGWSWCGDSDYSVLYPKNLNKLVENTKIKYMPLQEMLEGDPREVHVICMMQHLLLHPECEKLIKVGLTRLALDVVVSSECFSLDKTSNTLWGCLRLTKENYLKAVEMNISAKDLKIIWMLQDKKIKVVAEQVDFIRKYFYNSKDVIINNGHLCKFMKYCKEELHLTDKHTHELQDYLDYLRDCKILKLEMTKSQLFPKSFQTVHIEVATRLKEKEDEKERKEINKKEKLLRKMMPELEKLYLAEDEQFMIVIPKSKKDFNEEGVQQHNCVGGSYFNMMVNKKCVVVFLRKRSDPNKSFCTVEFSPEGDVRQNRTYCNQDAPIEAVKFINALSVKVKNYYKKLEYERKKAEKTA